MSEPRWWIAAQGRSWGPYPAARLAPFVAQRRLGPDSRVARTEGGPFTRAADTPELAALFTAATGDPAGAPPAEAKTGASPRESSRPLLVVGDAPEADLPQLEAALGEHGEAVRIRPGLWLLRTPQGAGPLRNALSRRVRGAMLLMVEAPLAHAAWFNLEGETDRASFALSFCPIHAVFAT